LKRSLIYIISSTTKISQRSDKIAETIKSIINDCSIAMKKPTKAREDIQQFDWKIVSNKFIEIFEETMATKNKK